MTAHRFFRYLWRANGILIFLSAMASLCLVLFVMFQAFGEWRHFRHDQDPIQVAGTKVAGGHENLGDLERVQGTNFYVAPLYAHEPPTMSLSSGYSQDTLNFLFFDRDSGQTRWLVPEKKQVFSWHEALTWPCDEKSSPVVGHLYRVIGADTNGDSRLTNEDLSSLAVSDPGGSRFTVLVKDIQDLHGHEVLGPGRVLVFFTSAQQLRVAEINIQDHVVVINKQLSAAGSP